MILYCNSNIDKLLLYRIRKFLDLESRLLFYNSYILPYIDYCLNIWGSASKE